MTLINWLPSVVSALTIVTALQAETHCPGNVASVPLRLANHYQVIVSVSVNHVGPYNFLLDTGTQITMVNPSLAAELHLNPQGAAALTTVGLHGTASIAQLDLIEVGSHAVAHQPVLVYDMQNPRFGDLRVRGVLGVDFLGQFDYLIDNAHSMLCLDDSGAMSAHIRGPHIALTMPLQAHGGLLPIASVDLSDGVRPVRLELDSGVNNSFLFDTSRYMRLEFLRNQSLPGSGLDGAERSFSSLGPQHLTIGRLELSKVTFVTFTRAQTDPTPSDFDGLLSTSLFSLVFINHTGHFAVFDPW